MDPLTVAAGVATVAAISAAWRMRRRALRAEAEVASLRGELQAERHAASHDSLTGLPNRRAFYQLGAALVADPSGHPLIAVVFDLDNFKQINDRFGHAAGDEVLITVAHRFAVYASDDLVARLGGDEFAGLLTSPSIDGRWLEQAARRLAEALAEPMQIAGHNVQITASVGLAPVRRSAHLAEALGHADAAMYRAKTSGHGASLTPHSTDDFLGHPDIRSQTLTVGIGPAHITGPATWLGRCPPTPRQLIGTTSHAEAGAP